MCAVGVNQSFMWNVYSTLILSRLLKLWTFTSSFLHPLYVPLYIRFWVSCVWFICFFWRSQKNWLFFKTLFLSPPFLLVCHVIERGKCVKTFILFTFPILENKMSGKFLQIKLMRLKHARKRRMERNMWKLILKVENHYYLTYFSHYKKIT